MTCSVVHFLHLVHVTDTQKPMFEGGADLTPPQVNHTFQTNEPLLKFTLLVRMQP